MRLLLLIPILFAASPVLAKDKSATLDPNQRICRQTAVIGQLVPTRRECHTRAEWATMARNGNDNARDKIDRDRASGSSTPS